MFPLGPDPRRSAPPVFSLDRKDIALAKQRRGLSRTEWRVVLFMPFLLAALGWALWDLKEAITTSRTPRVEHLPLTSTLAPMPRPGWDKLAALPDATAIAAEHATAAALIETGSGVPLTASGLDATTMAWAEARLEADRSAPPLPQRLAARDLLLSDHVRLGTPLIIDGLLDDRLPGPVAGSDRPWQRLLLAIDEGQYVEVLSDAKAAADIPIGTQVRVTGRLLAYDERDDVAVAVEPPPAAAAPAAAPAKNILLPVVLGRVVVESSAPQDGVDALAEFHRPFSTPEGLYSEVDDFRLWTETRPYYYLLGQVLRDQTTAGAWDGAPDGNQAADDMHLRPADFRGKPFEVTGFVYEAWEDTEVARDQPFGVARVLRLLLWRRDIAMVTESIDGVEKRSMQQVLRLYEFAAITDQKAPPRGTLVTTHGRFLKKRAIPVKVDPMRDRANNVQRQSDRVYTWLFVTGPWQEVPATSPPGMSALDWGIAGLAFVLLVIGIVWWRREVRFGDRRMHGQISAVRASRKRLHDKDDEAAAATPASSPAAPGEQAPPPS